MRPKKIQSKQAMQYVREVVKREQPETVEHLVRLVQQDHKLSEEEIMNIVCRARLCFTKPPTRGLDLKRYIVSTNARWYWFIMAFSMLTVTVVLFLPEIDPLFYIRYLLGTAHVLWIPGYCLVKALFPGGKAEKLELVALGMVTSIVLVSLMAFVLHYTPWGIKTESVTVVLFILTLALSTVAASREQRQLKSCSRAP